MVSIVCLQTTIYNGLSLDPIINIHASENQWATLIYGVGQNRYGPIYSCSTTKYGQK